LFHRSQRGPQWGSPPSVGLPGLSEGQPPNPTGGPDSRARDPTTIAWQFFALPRGGSVPRPNNATTTEARKAFAGAKAATRASEGSLLIPRAREGPELRALGPRELPAKLPPGRFALRTAPVIPVGDFVSTKGWNPRKGNTKGGGDTKKKGQKKPCEWFEMNWQLVYGKKQKQKTKHTMVWFCSFRGIRWTISVPCRGCHFFGFLTVPVSGSGGWVGRGMCKPPPRVAKRPWWGRRSREKFYNGPALPRTRNSFFQSLWETVV